MDTQLVIDCGECALAETAACDDCVVSFVCDRGTEDAVVIDVGELRAMRALQRGGLLPDLRHRRRTG
ncbi:MAG: hypothetical protein S0880_09200 [Actinomycetota bacterium]|nr:hypothetical protein [Actinomycetota bacterium]